MGVKTVGVVKQMQPFLSQPTLTTIKIVKKIRTPLGRLALLLAAGLALLGGLYAATVLLGYNGHRPLSGLASSHGPLMVFGFVGGAIALERAVAIRRWWGWGAPIASAIAVAAVFLHAPVWVPGAAWAVSFAVLTGVYAEAYRRQGSLALIIQAAGSVAAVFAALRWAEAGVFTDALGLAMMFTVATIIGERVELARLSFSRGHREETITVLILALLAAAVVAPVGALATSIERVFGLLLVAVAVASLRADVARNLVRTSKLPRFSAACMLLGYGWLVVAGLAIAFFGLRTTGFAYDACVHGVFLGFVISMIFAHAPIILGAVIRKNLPYHTILYAPVVLLHGGLLIRLGAGDLLRHDGIWRAGAIVTIVAVLGFIATGIFSGISNRGKRKR